MRRFLFTAVLLFVLTGCAAGHYYKKNMNTVDFYLKLPEARAVAFASSLDGFKVHPLVKQGREIWKITLPADREFAYFYIVDGKIFVPASKLHELDDFGSKNCVYSPDL